MYVGISGDEAGLVQRCLEGDSEAFRPLVERYQDVLFRVALRMLGDPEDARDCAQNAFMKAYTNLASYNVRFRFFSWLYRILLNDCLNVLRARRPTEAIDPLLEAPDSPFERARSRETRDRVQAAILQLSPEHREVIVLRHLADLTYAEIADTTGLPEKTVKSRLFSARQRLADLLLATGAAR